MISFNSNESFNKTRMISRRMFVLGIGKAIVFFGIIGRLASLQITESTKYKTLSDKNRFREWKVAPERGLIRDFFDNIIASNEKVYQLHITPENSKDVDILLNRIKNILYLTDSRINFLKRRMAKQKPWEPLIVSDNLSWTEFARINLFLHELEGAEPIVSVARVYPHQSVAHVVGYVSEVGPKDLAAKEYLRDMAVTGIAVGKTGMEQKFDQQIIGQVGYQRYEVNAFGKRIKQIAVNKGIQGQNYLTTLDFEVQKYAAELMQDKSGAVCVMDIFDGDIIALVSAPTFDPNKFVHGIDNKTWKELTSHRDKPLINKAISGLYPPGSTIKTIVALCALENDIASTKMSVDCQTSIELYGEKFHCWKKEGHRFTNMRKAIKESCDIYFYEIARKLGVDRIAETAKSFGLGAYHLEGFKEEKKGVVPNTTWKKRFIGKNWYLGETLHSGIGQGYFQTSPMQLCVMTAQLANGGYEVKPRLTLDENVNTGIKLTTDFETFYDPIYEEHPLLGKRLFRNQENIKFVKEAMFASTNEPGGTSYSSRFNEKDYQYAGKTGTSQTKRITQAQREADLEQTSLPYLDRDHALFVAFAPYENPRYAISVLVEHGGSGSSAAAPVAKKVIGKLIERHNLRMAKKNSLGLNTNV